MQLLVKLLSADGIIIALEEAIARISGLIGGILLDQDGIPVAPITLPGDIPSTILKLIFEQWAVHHRHDPECLAEYLPNLDNMRNLPEWDERFLAELDVTQLIAVASAAEHLKIPKLVHFSQRMHRLRGTARHQQQQQQQQPMMAGGGHQPGGGGSILEGGSIILRGREALPPGAVVIHPHHQHQHQHMELIEDDEGLGIVGEDADGNLRHYPYLHSQAIIEISQLLR